MKTLSTGILWFCIGFFGLSIFIDTPETIIVKSKIFLGGVIIAAILKSIDDIKNS